MSRINRWWARRSGPERFDLYTRGTVYVISGSAALVPLAVVDGAGTGWTAGAVAYLATAVAHAAACVRLLHTGFGYYLRRRPLPLAGLVAVLALTAAQVGVATAAFGPRIVAPDGLGPLFDVLYLVGLATLAAVAPLVRAPWIAVLGVAWAAGVGALGLREGLPGDAVALLALLVAVVTLWFALSYRSSVWAVGVLWEMDRTRGAQARLAVAEERLRFARDLHDVLGRNLSVVAVRSELAAELARRGRPEAVAEMLGVRELAQDSLRDLREVVRGYRSADLRAELEGARSVLRAAGIDAHVRVDAEPLPPPVQEALGWVAREGTTNVLRHSAATTCRIEVTVEGGRAVLTVENDGVRDPAAGEAVAPRGGSGLPGLAERVAALGGSVTAGPAAPDRFVLTAAVPLAVPGPPPTATRRAAPTSPPTSAPTAPSVAPARSGP